ncbi:zinc knuckle CX2CX4HX4C containing protein [Tanacetum coccineum]
MLGYRLWLDDHPKILIRLFQVLLQTLEWVLLQTGELVRDVVDGVASDDCITSMNGDVITELFGVSLSTPKDIDAFTSDLELGKYWVWSELTREKRQEVMNTIWSIWNTLVVETPIETNANPMPSKVSADPIVQSVSIEKPSSYVGAAVGSESETSKSKANFRLLFSENVCEGAKFSIPRKVVETGKYGLTRIMMNSKGFFFFKFKSSKGLDDNMENGPWMIRNSPIILKKWSMDTRLCKEELTRIPVWVKIHDVPIQVSSPPTVVTFNIVTSIVEKTNDGFQMVGKKKKKGKSKSTNGGQFVSLLMVTTGTSSEKGKFTTSNSYSALDDESEEDVENVYDELANLFPNSKTSGSSSFKAAAG